MGKHASAASILVLLLGAMAIYDLVVPREEREERIRRQRLSAELRRQHEGDRAFLEEFDYA
jgi:hypothetical protein